MLEVYSVAVYASPPAFHDQAIINLTYLLQKFRLGISVLWNAEQRERAVLPARTSSIPRHKLAVITCWTTTCQGSISGLHVILASLPAVQIRNRSSCRH